MDILDIIIAKKKSFTGETEKLTRQAQEAMAKANEVAAKIDDAQAALDAAAEAQQAAEAANARSEEVAAQFDEISENLDEAVRNAASEVVDEKIQSATSAIASDAAEAKNTAAEAVTSVDVIDANTSAAKIKRTRVRKKGVEQAYDTMKNYTSTGQNEDGSMTQKAITNALENQKTELTTQINNIVINGGGSENISGNISPEDSGSIVAVDDNGNITSSTITEEDIILTQIIAGTYQNDNIIGLEIDYANKTFKRLQGAKNKTAGNDFNSYTMLGGRKRCIVNEDGSIVRFLTTMDTIENIEDKRIMVYQPLCYFMRIPLSTVTTANGIKINKEQIYLSDTKYAGFELHPIFKDKDGNEVKYVLLPAYESGTLRANGEFVKDDQQNITFSTDKLVSIVNTKPISGYTQNFTYDVAEQMAENNGEGWQLTDLRFESLHQMLMSIEYGSMNLQNTFDLGLSRVNISGEVNISSISGSTHSLLNESGRAENTTNITNGITNVYNEEGKCAISYRGLENPYGNIWRFIGGVEVENRILSCNGEEINFKLPTVPGWISAFGYDENHKWVFLPIECEGSSTLPVGDYSHLTNSSTVNSGLAGGLINSQDNCGPFYYGFNVAKANYHYRSDSARIMHIPTAGSTIELNNYRAWINS